MFRQKFQGWQIRSASWRENEGFHHLWNPCFWRIDLDGVARMSRSTLPRCWQHVDPQTTSEAAPPKFCKNTWQLNNSFLGAFFYIHVSKSLWIQTSLVTMLTNTTISWTLLSRSSCPFNVTAMSLTCGCCQAPAANYRQRVLYHSKRFHEKDQQDVLQRYETRRHTMSVSELQRCTFHISSWIAKLPATKMIQRHGGLSAVILLRHYLESLAMHGEHELCPQLSKLLTRVFMQLSANLDDVQWMRLKTMLMPLLPNIQASFVEPKMCKMEKLLPSLEPKDSEDGVRHHATAIQFWRNQTSNEDQEIYVADLERSLREDVEESKLRRVFRAAVAALSPPRLLPKMPECRSSSLDVAGRKEVDGSYLSNALQQRLRIVVLGCLERLQFEDPKIQASKDFLEILLQQVQELATQGLVAAHRDWLHLQLKCGMLKEMPVEVAESKHQRSSRECQHGRRPDKCKECRPCPHGKSRTKCSRCSGCPHGKLKYNCCKCMPCPHGKLRPFCRFCSSCAHGKLKYHCTLCRNENNEFGHESLLTESLLTLSTCQFRFPNIMRTCCGCQWSYCRFLICCAINLDLSQHFFNKICWRPTPRLKCFENPEAPYDGCFNQSRFSGFFSANVYDHPSKPIRIKLGKLLYQFDVPSLSLFWSIAWWVLFCFLGNQDWQRYRRC